LAERKKNGLLKPTGIVQRLRLSKPGGAEDEKDFRKGRISACIHPYPFSWKHHSKKGRRDLWFEEHFGRTRLPDSFTEKRKEDEKGTLGENTKFQTRPGKNEAARGAERTPETNSILLTSRKRKIGGGPPRLKARGPLTMRHSYLGRGGEKGILSFLVLTLGVPRREKAQCGSGTSETGPRILPSRTRPKPEEMVDALA